MEATIVYKEDGEDGAFYDGEGIKKASGDSVYWEPEAITMALKSFDIPFKVYSMPDDLYYELNDQGIMNGFPKELSTLPLDQCDNRTQSYL